MLIQTLRRAGIYSFPLPRADVHAGTVLDARFQVFDDLLLQPIWSAPPELRPAVPAHLLFDSIQRQHTVSAHARLGLPQIGSAQVLIRGAQKLAVRIEGVSLRQVQVNGQPVLPAQWLDVLARCPHPEFKRRKLGQPSPRKLDVVVATVHAEQIDFVAQSSGVIGGEVEAAVQLDVRAGLKVEWSAERGLTWRAGEIPIGFLPLRYAWQEATRRFMLAST